MNVQEEINVWNFLLNSAFLHFKNAQRISKKGCLSSLGANTVQKLSYSFKSTSKIIQRTRAWLHVLFVPDEERQGSLETLCALHLFLWKKFLPYIVQYTSFMILY